MNNAIVPGSLSAIAQQENRSIAESFLNVDLLAIVDMSGSMSCEDAPDHKARWVAAREELATLQKQYPGKIAVIAFSGHAELVPGGSPMPMGGDTDMVAALQAAKPADGLGIKIVLLSDGEPNDRDATLAAARKFKTKIDVIYIGPEGGRGQEFLRSLAAATRGTYACSTHPGMLQEPIALLLSKH